MALLSATVPRDQIDEICQRESDFLAIAVDLVADQFTLLGGGVRNRFEAAVGKALDKETDRILSLIARGTSSPQ